MATQELTEYERTRLQNIRRNGDMMAALNIHSITSQLSAAKHQRITRVGSSSSRASNPEKKPKTQTSTVIRRSLRARVRPLKPSPRVLGPFSMRDAYSGAGSDRALIDTILSAEKGSLLGFSIKESSVEYKTIKEELSDGAHDSVKGVVNSENLDCEPKIMSREFDGCVDLGSMRLEGENVARVVPGRIMVVKFLPCNDLTMIVAGNRSGNVGFWNVDCNGEGKDGMYLYRPHTGVITGFCFSNFVGPSVDSTVGILSGVNFEDTSMIYHYN